MTNATPPLAIDLYCGLGGWAEGLLAEGWDVVGFDIERHRYGPHSYPAQLVLQDVLTLHGSQFRNAALIVASPPCQEYSYMAMPWQRGKVKAAAIRADETGQMLADLNRLFNACFRIQAQASLAAGHHVPMVVENVRGAQPWVGRARWNFGSYYLWGDVPALMPAAMAFKSHGLDWRTQREVDFTRLAGRQALEAAGIKMGDRNIARATDGHKWSSHWTNPAEHGIKHHGSGAIWFDTGPAALPSSSLRRKEASALIAKIPLPLARHIAAIYRLRRDVAA